MNFIEITSQSLEWKIAKRSDSQFRSIEKKLENLNRSFNTNNLSKVIIVTVMDKADAMLLAERLKLESVGYSENGVMTTIQIELIEKSGSPKNIVRILQYDKNMTLRELTRSSLKELQKTHFLKSQILKSKIISKEQLEKYLADGTLQEVNHGT